MPCKKRKDQEQRKLLRKASTNCKVLEKLFHNSPSKGNDNANYELKDFKHGLLCSNESVDCKDITMALLRQKLRLRKKVLRQVVWLMDEV